LVRFRAWVSGPALSAAASVVVSFFGLSVLVGRRIGLASPTVAQSSPPPLDPSSALAFTLAGLALAALQRPPVSRRRRGIAFGCATLGGVVGIGTLIAFALGRWTGDHGPPSFHTGLCLALLGVALVLLDVRPRRGPDPAQLLSLVAIHVALLALVGHATGNRALYVMASANDGGMGVSAALLTTVLGVGVLCSRPDVGFMAVLWDAGGGGVVARRLLLIPVLVPMAVWLVLAAALWAGLISREFGGGLFTVFYFVAFTLIIWWVASVVRRAEAARARAEEATRRLADELEQRVHLRTAELAASEIRLAGIVSTAKDAIITTDAQQEITLFNPAAEQMFGCLAAAALGRPLAQFMPPESVDEPGARAPADPPESTTDQLRSGTVGMRTDGAEFPLEASVSQGEVDGRRVYTVVVRDVTDRKRLEEQYRQAQKMEAIGQLAGGIAHDFNNLLTVISGYSELILETLAPHDQLREQVEGIYAAGERAALLTGQLLTFSRKQVVEPRLLDLNAVVTAAEGMLRRLIGEDVVLSTALAPHPLWVTADSGQIGQVIMNLAVNARDAMPQGGRLTIETAPVTLDKEYTRAHAGVTPGQYVLLAVSDTGCGMTAETQARVFEPFFTSKEPGKGTGLGLSTVYAIVRQGGGHVWAYSEIGRGTSFKVYLPAIRPPSQTATAVAQPAAERMGNETVLLVEDDDAVRAMTRLGLELHGYTVLEARCGDDALRLFDGHAGTIHLIITDVVMPGMSGRQVADAVARRRPGTPVLYCSGYTDDAVLRHGVLQAEAAFLQKPFMASALAAKVRGILDGGA
jgi:two-component system cell cycle sensor histidine kinase/response regulator CckA